MTKPNTTETQTEIKPANPANFKKAISTGQAMTKKGGVTKAEVARAIYDRVKDLAWKNINLEERTISLWRPKVQNESLLYMTDRVYCMLARRNREKKSRFLFTNKKGSKHGYSTVSIRKAFRRGGLNDCTIHTLRHTHASRLIQNGISIYEVKEILGHADIKTTMKYAHLEQRNFTSRARDAINRFNGVTEEE